MFLVRTRIALGGLAVVVLCGCTHTSKPAAAKPDPQLISNWSYELGRKEPFDQPFMAHFKLADKDLFFVAAHHEQRDTSDTFQLVERTLNSKPIKHVIIEGIDTAQGASPKSYLDYAENSQKDGFFEGGEPAYTALLANRRGLQFVGGEPTDKEVLRRIRAMGYTEDDLRGFYFLRQIPQYRRQEKLDTSDIKALFNNFQAGIDQEIGERRGQPFDFDAFLAWHKARQRHNFSPELVDTETVAPLAQGKHFTNKLSTAVGRARNQHLLNLIAASLKEHKQIMVVYGAGHMAQLRRALTDWLGKPVQQATLPKRKSS